MNKKTAMWIMLGLAILPIVLNRRSLLHSIFNNSSPPQPIPIEMSDIEIIDPIEKRPTFFRRLIRRIKQFFV